MEPPNTGIMLYLTLIFLYMVVGLLMLILYRFIKVSMFPKPIKNPCPWLSEKIENYCLMDCTQCIGYDKCVTLKIYSIKRK